jgi:hypothetical protein
MKVSLTLKSLLLIIDVFCSFPFPAGAVTYSTRSPVTAYRGGTPVATTPASTIAFPQPGDNSILRPTAGEQITAGTTYTVKWASPAVNIVNLELNDKKGNARGYGKLCPGWLINAYCGLLGVDIPNTGEFVWHVEWDPPDATYGFQGEFWLDLYVTTRSNVGVSKFIPWR